MYLLMYVSVDINNKNKYHLPNGEKLMNNKCY